MPIIPTITKREFIKTPGVDASVPAPARLAAAYENNLSRFGTLIPAAIRAASKVNAGITSAGVSVSARSSAGENLRYPGGTTENVKAEERAQADKDLTVRMALVDAVRQDAGAKGVQALETAAVKNFTPETASGPAARDYAVLHRAAREEQAASASVRARESADTEKTLLRQVGALVRSPEALDEYLSGQVAAYEERLRGNGESEVAVKANARAVRAQTVEENVCRSLSCGDWRAAEATLSKHGDKLPDAARQTCAAKTRALFARSQAEKLWEEGRLETGGSAGQIRRYALEHIAEPDVELGAAMRQTVEALSRREGAREHALAAQTLASAARLPSADALGVLDGAPGLDAEELAQARQAALFFDGDNTRSDAAQFVACYFGGTQKEHARLLKREKISARDYVRLEASRHARQSGDSRRAQELLCRGIDVWMQKKGFSAQDSYAAQYAVLTADAPSGSLGDVWKQIKNLLDV